MLKSWDWGLGTRPIIDVLYAVKAGSPAYCIKVLSLTAKLGVANSIITVLLFHDQWLFLSHQALYMDQAPAAAYLTASVTPCTTDPS